MVTTDRAQESDQSHAEPAVTDLVSNIMVDFMAMAPFAENPLILTEGDGVRVRDIEGRWYVDGLSGTFNVSLGHGRQTIIEAASRQMARLAMAAPTLGTNDRSLELARLLLGLLPARYTHLKWASGGSEAVEQAIKMARQYHRQAGDPRKFKVLSHYRAYHGATGQALAATGWPHASNPYEPLAEGFIHLHTPDPYHSPFSGTPEEIGRAYARLVEETIELEGPRTIAALITEPIMMSAGVIVPPASYMKRIRELCTANDIILIFDEIITGFGRVGRMFASELFDVWPDILVFGKGISGGYAALSVTVLTESLASAFWGTEDDNVHFQAGHTYGGHPVACAVGFAAIDDIIANDVVGNARDRGEQAVGRLRALQGKYSSIGDVRGVGLLCGVEFVKDLETKERYPAMERVGLRVRDAARRRGLLIRASHWMAVLAPPLTISHSEMSETLDILQASLEEALEPYENSQ
jgi:adenosylmethionine-8-amino-7-oxononanoate aminotransferase